MLSRRLQRIGHSVVIAIDGEEGLSLASTEMPDIILMDISLPGMDGCEVTRRLKADKRTRQIPVIVLTAHALLTAPVKEIHAGGDDYGTKPVDFGRLSEKIHNCLLEKKAQ